MRPQYMEKGRAELLRARRESRDLFWAAALFSSFVNLLMLTGPVFMLQVYDRVLSSRSVETLVALFILITFLFGMMGILDYARGRVLARIGARFQERLDRRVFAAVLRKAAVAPGKDGETANNLRDLEAVQRLLSSPVFAALFDVLATPFFLVGILIFHELLFWLAVAGAAVLSVITYFNQKSTRLPVVEAAAASQKAERMSEQIRSEAEMVRSMGMEEAAFSRWHVARADSLASGIRSSDVAGAFGTTTKTFRLFLQSSMLGLGAWLVLRNELTPGAMIAGSILLGRALAPLDTAIGQWALVQRAWSGWRNLTELLGTVPEEPKRMTLPTPKAQLGVKNLSVAPPGAQQAVLRMISFDLSPGQALGVIGPSGSGKSTLARAITGAWPAAAGQIRLDGVLLEQYRADVLGRHIGYLPQRVQLFDGPISENIAHLSPDMDPEKVVAAAKKADAHEMILQLPDGYDTRVTSGGGRLSGGQIQRLGLARAMYFDPIILVLDEPNSNLDNEGNQALNGAIRQMKEDGRSILIMAHRPNAIQECDLILVLDSGLRKAFGPKEEVLAQTVRNYQSIRKAEEQGGVA